MPPGTPRPSNRPGGSLPGTRVRCSAHPADTHCCRPRPRPALLSAGAAPPSGTPAAGEAGGAETALHRLPAAIARSPARLPARVFVPCSFFRISVKKKKLIYFIYIFSASTVFSQNRQNPRPPTAVKPGGAAARQARVARSCPSEDGGGGSEVCALRVPG